MTETSHHSEAHSEAHPEKTPRNNPCAQCGAPIAIPEWIEHDQKHVAYLWHCYACDYQFEAVAYFPDGDDGHALAA